MLLGLWFCGGFLWFFGLFGLGWVFWVFWLVWFFNSSVWPRVLEIKLENLVSLFHL